MGEIIDETRVRPIARLSRLDLSAGKVIAEETLFSELDVRIRDIRTGPEGALYILTPDRVIRVIPRD